MYKRYLSSVGFLFVGVIAGFFLGSTGGPDSTEALRARDARYPLINPLLACLAGENKEATELEPLTQKIAETINKNDIKKLYSKVSVYYRDLDNGHWAGINENEEYEPASLLKVPVMIAVYKYSETHPEILSKILHYVNTDGPDPTVAKPYLTSGRDYSMDEIIKSMIIDSSNPAKELILSSVDYANLGEIFGDLGLDSPFKENQSLDYGLSAKSYSLFFRILYNSTFLTRDLSQKALDILSESQFKLGLVAPLPSSVKVAHKYGIRVVDANKIELSDCGIVYKEGDEYLLCVMTEGDNAYNLASVISDISSSTWSYLSSK